MNQDRNKKRRKFDYVANLIDYSISLNRDNDVQIDYSFVKPQDLKKSLNEYKEDSHFSKNNLRNYDKGGSFSVKEYEYTHTMCSLIDYCVYEIDELNKKITKFVNGMN